MANTLIKVAKNPTEAQKEELLKNNAAPVITRARKNGEEFPVVVFQSTWKWNPCDSIREQVIFTQDIDDCISIHPIVKDYLAECHKIQAHLV
jgi:hypothetical protein